MTDSKLIKILDDLYIPEDFKKDHAYFADAEGTKAYHGVTSILKVIAKPALIGWAVNMMDEHIRANVAYAIPSEDGGYWAIKPSVIEEARTAHRRKKEDAGLKGTGVHDEIELLVKGVIGAWGGIIDPDTKSSNPQVQRFI